MTDDPSGNPQNQPSSDEAKPPKEDPQSLRDAIHRVQRYLEGDSKIPQADYHADQDAPVDESVTATDDVPETEELKPPNRPTAREKQAMNTKVDREKRQTLRRVQGHLVSAQVALGAQHVMVDLVEVLHHSENRAGSLNYVTPRKKTAWVSGDQIQRGLNYLQERGRLPRFRYIEGLYPPMFAHSLSKLNMEVEVETPIMVYQHTAAEPTPPAQPPEGVRLETVREVRGMETWWYVWQNAHYDIFTLGVEPLLVGRSLANVALGNQVDLLAYQGNFPFGVARVTVHDQTAHIAGVALLREMKTPELHRALVRAALMVAIEQGCNLVFMPGITAEDRRVSRSLGFVDFGSMVCYAAKLEQTNPPAGEHGNLAQPILDIKSNLSSSRDA